MQISYIGVWWLDLFQKNEHYSRMSATAVRDSKMNFANNNSKSNHSFITAIFRRMSSIGEHKVIYTFFPVGGTPSDRPTLYEFGFLFKKPSDHMNISLVPKDGTINPVYPRVSIFVIGENDLPMPWTFCSIIKTVNVNSMLLLYLVCYKPRRTEILHNWRQRKTNVGIFTTWAGYNERI